jgi:hypothetical protein
MAGREDLVSQAINEPLSIYQSDLDPDRKVFYLPSRFDPMPTPTFVRVIVDYSEGGQGRQRRGTVITAFPVDGPRQGETFLWPV